MSSRVTLVRVLPWLMPMLATAVCFGLHAVLPRADMSLIYLAGVLICAMFTAMKPSLICALISFMLLNYFFISPEFDLSLIDGRQLVTLALLMMVALVTGHLAARLHEKVKALEIGNRWNHQQIALARDLALCVRQEEVIDVLTNHLWSCFRLRARLRIEDANPVHATHPQYGDNDGSTLQLEANRAQILFIHERRISACIDVAVKHRDSSQLRHYLEGFTQLAGLAWRRTLAEQQLRQQLAIKESERIREELLAAISEDLQLPLTTLKQELSAVKAEAEQLSGAAQSSLIRAGCEVARLNRYLQNLYDLLQLGQGAPKLEISRADSAQIIENAVSRLARKKCNRTVDLCIDGDLPEMNVHSELVEQAVFNLLENAVQYSSDCDAVSVNVSSNDGWLQIDVTDRGPGIPRDYWHAIFEMFNQGGHHKLAATGTGLGLVVSQGVAEAHGGFCKVLSSSPEGTTMRLSLPQTTAKAA